METKLSENDFLLIITLKNIGLSNSISALVRYVSQLCICPSNTNFKHSSGLTVQMIMRRAHDC